MGSVALPAVLRAGDASGQAQFSTGSLQKAQHSQLTNQQANSSYASPSVSLKCLIFCFVFNVVDLVKFLFAWCIIVLFKQIKRSSVLSSLNVSDDWQSWFLRLMFLNSLCLLNGFSKALLILSLNSIRDKEMREGSNLHLDVGFHNLFSVQLFSFFLWHQNMLTKCKYVII